MPKKVLPRIEAVSPGDEPLTLRVRWRKDGESVIDVSGMIKSFKVYSPLRQSPELFRQVRVGEYGTDIVWPDDIDMSADTLWRLAQEQAGATMTPDEFRQWRERRAYTQGTAARALGISQRIVAYYEHGDRAIPRVVMLATRGVDGDGLRTLAPARSRGKGAVMSYVSVKAVKAGTRHKLVDAVAGEADLSKTTASKAVEAVFQSITGTLKDGGEVRLVGFGTFSVANRAASEGRNPRTGKKIKIPASKQARFKPGRSLRESLNSYVRGQ